MPQLDWKIIEVGGGFVAFKDDESMTAYLKTRQYRDGALEFPVFAAKGKDEPEGVAKLTVVVS